MKIFRLYSLLTVLLSTLIISCSKNEAFIEPLSENEINNIDIKLLTYPNPTSKGGDESSMLVFNSLGDVKNQVALLESQTEAYDDAFIKIWGHLSEEELNDKDEELGFDDYRALKEFNTLYGFNNSMFTAYELAENTWLSKDSLILSKDPDLLFFNLEPEELVLLNNDRAVKIGNSIFKTYSNGCIEIPNGDIEVFGRYVMNSGDEITGDYYTDDEIIIHTNDGDSYTGGSGVVPPTPTNSCFTDESERTTWHTENNRKMKGVVKVTNSGVWGVKIKSKTKYYKKGTFGWRKYRSNLTAALDGFVDASDISNCGDNAIELDEDTHFQYKEGKKRAKYVYGATNGAQKFLVKNNTLKGVHKQKNNRREHYLND